MAKKKWIQKAIKKKGALREELGVEKGEKIPVKIIHAEIKELQAKDKLTEPARLKLRRLILARTLRGFKK